MTGKKVFNIFFLFEVSKAILNGAQKFLNVKFGKMTFVLNAVWNETKISGRENKWGRKKHIATRREAHF